MALQITDLPTPPSTAAPSTFATLADAFIAALPEFVDDANALAGEVETNAAAAAVAAELALAAANFLGAWSAQTGPATVPSSVSHIGRFWILKSDIADITTKVPGTATEWEEIRRGTTAWQRKTGTYTAVEGDRLLCDTIAVGAFTVTLPANPNEGDEISFVDGGFTTSSAGWGANNLTVARNGNTIMGLSENLTCSTRGAAFRLVYINSDWRVVPL